VLVVPTVEFSPECATTAIFTLSKNGVLASARLVTFKTPLVSFVI
jgi:hypothetical protein